jgi:hypothetical protein
MRFPHCLDGYYQRDAPQRGLLYQLSTMLGHSTPAISLEHYIHGLDSLLGNAIWRYYSVAPEVIGNKVLGLALRTYQRWTAGGWQTILSGMMKRAPDRCAQRATNTGSKRKKENKPDGELYERYRSIWEVLKTMNDGSLTPRDTQLHAVYEQNQLEKWHTRANDLYQKGLIKKPYPTLPQGERSNGVIRQYASRLQTLGEDDAGRGKLRDLCHYWQTYRLSDRGALRFNTPVEARGYLDCLLALGIPWAQIRLVWVGSRYTQRELKQYRGYWRKTLQLSGKIAMDTRSTHNNRPLGKTKGYLDVVVINPMPVDGESPAEKSSEEFAWMVWMSLIEGV